MDGPINSKRAQLKRNLHLYYIRTDTSVCSYSMSGLPGRAMMRMTFFTCSLCFEEGTPLGGGGEVRKKN